MGAMGEELDEAVWSQLPAEILEHVLRRLPVEVLFKFRTVCKHWRTLPLSPKFCSAVTQPRSKQAYLLGIEKIGSLQKCPVYNPVAESWSRFDLGFLESRFERFTFERWSNYDEDRFGGSEFKGVSSDGGLLAVCVRIHESEQDAIFVCNPLTKACNLLPLIEGSTWGLCLGLAIRMESYGHYRVFATKHGKVENKFEQRLYMYDSVSAFWKLVPKCPRFSHDAISGVFCNGVYYALYEDAGQDHDVLMSFDIDHDVWVDTGVAMSHQGFKKKLVECNGRLFSVSSTRDGSEKDLYLTILEVNLYTSTAVKISAMEHVTLPDGGHKHWDAIGYRNSIVLLTRSHKAFAFDLTADLPEWKPIDLNNFEPCVKCNKCDKPRQLPKLLVSFTFDLRATVD
ncbi:hypothetical protein M758_1G172200 [Ceratodon purpureus]|uniref:F-box domain-containing protein n=1 Tax=Ceratodon purpureus TaxID=3225 RepID=A0A8T0J886_CERPU|nr:hypothetical protein KC19_1G175600 [Ceratodon purpureus]KAG0630349.1 hypothetical protein M758_1G172200 [Ceratodon purpureus]